MAAERIEENPAFFEVNFAFDGQTLDYLRRRFSNGEPGSALGAETKKMYRESFPKPLVEIAVEKGELGAAQVLMPISARKQLNDLPEDMLTKITFYYSDRRNALIKGLAE